MRIEKVYTKTHIQLKIIILDSIHCYLDINSHSAESSQIMQFKKVKAVEKVIQNRVIPLAAFKTL
jgi:hypothetical protein